MITKDTYRQVQIAILSGVAEYKDENKKEVWSRNKYGDNITIELLDDEKLIERIYYSSDMGHCRYENEYQYGMRNGKAITYYDKRSNYSVQEVGNCKDGKLEGEGVCYYANGKVHAIRYWENDQIKWEIVSRQIGEEICIEEIKKTIERVWRERLVSQKLESF